jgi:hypothetical protein
MLKRIATVCALLVAATAPLSATKLITDESLRMDVLQAVFPKTTISLAVGRSINDSWGPTEHSKEFLFPDALATEKVYRVVGPASGRDEECAASDVMNYSSFSQIREVRFQVFPWPGAADSGSLLAVLQYAFPGANPPGSCSSLARVSRVMNVRGKWRESVGFDLAITHHGSIQRIELANLAGGHSQELLVESDWGGAGVHGTNLAIFSLSLGRFDQWLNVPSRVYSSADGDSFVQTLDLPRTRHRNAERFCFRRIMFAKDGLWLSQPVETRPCYPRFTGEPAKSRFYNVL